MQFIQDSCEKASIHPSLLKLNRDDSSSACTLSVGCADHSLCVVLSSREISLRFCYRTHAAVSLSGLAGLHLVCCRDGAVNNSGHRHVFLNYDCFCVALHSIIVFSN